MLRNGWFRTSYRMSQGRFSAAGEGKSSTKRQGIDIFVLVTGCRRKDFQLQEKEKAVRNDKE